MATIWRVGESVTHPHFGVGRIESVLAGGLKLRIYFNSISTYKTILAEFFESPPPTPPMPPQKPPSSAGLGYRKAPPPPEPLTPPTGPPEEHTKARLAIECLRQGLPPPGGLKQWTVGLQEAQTQIGSALDDATRQGKGTLLVIEGGYGQGKSHIGRWARELALSRQISTMNTELDGGGISLANSSRLLTHLFSSLRLPNDSGAADPVPGLGTLLRNAARHKVPSGCELFRPFLEQAHAWDGNEEAIEVLEEYLSAEIARSSAEQRLRALGMYAALPALGVNYGTLGDRLIAQAEQLARIVDLARPLGSKAALIVIDELDHEFSESDRVRSQRALDTIKTWSRILSQEPVVLLLLAPRGLAGWPACRRIGLPLLSIKELKTLTKNVVEVFRKERADLVVRDGVERLFARLLADFDARFKSEGWGPRYFVRATVEACERAVEKGIPLESALA